MEKQFKFKLGAIVTHITETSTHHRFVVLGRCWMESAGGVEELYNISTNDSLNGGFRRMYATVEELQLVVEAKK